MDTAHALAEYRSVVIIEREFVKYLSCELQIYAEQSRFTCYLATVTASVQEYA